MHDVLVHSCLQDVWLGDGVELVQHQLDLLDDAALVKLGHFLLELIRVDGVLHLLTEAVLRARDFVAQHLANLRPDERHPLVVELVEAAGLSLQVRIQSFDERVVREAWRLNPRLCYGLLIDKPKNPRLLLPHLGLVPQYVNPHFSLVNRELTEYLHAKQIRMIPWTVNSKEDMLAMRQCGADGIITDYPELAFSLFGLPEDPSL